LSYQPINETGLYDQPAPRITWGLKEIGLGFVIIICSYVVVFAAIVAPIDASYGADSAESRFAEALSVTLVDLLAIGGVIFLVGRTGGTLADLGFRAPVRPRQKPSLSSLINPPSNGFPWGYTAALVVGGLVAAYLSTAVYGAIVEGLDIEALQPSDQIPEDYFSSTAVVAMLGIGVIGAAPIAEEMFFRGFMFPGLRKLSGFWPAALVSSLLFASAHFQLGLVIPFGIIGFILAYLYHRSGSLIPPIGMHFLFNLFSFLVLVFYPEAR
jgi:membrane protease YdiL (CAAX protease family)